MMLIAPKKTPGVSKGDESSALYDVSLELEYKFPYNYADLGGSAVSKNDYYVTDYNIHVFIHKPVSVHVKRVAGFWKGRGK